jgi:acyl-CoA-dependent ceramide synthase
MIVWLLARHILYMIVWWSIYDTLPRTITYGCYIGAAGNVAGPFKVPNDFTHFTIPFRNPEGLVCWDGTVTNAFLAMLGALQVILLLWFVMILKVAYKVLKGGEAEDSRSDDEELSEESIEIVDFTPDKKEQTNTYFEIQPPFEEEVGVEGIRLTHGRASSSRRIKKGEGSTTAVSIRGHSAHKDLLGRIGCDKQS